MATRRPLVLVSGAVQELPPGDGLAGAGAGAGVIVSDTPPLPTPGVLWFDSETGTLSVGYDDGDSVQWVSVATQGEPGTQIHVGPSAPADPQPNQLWFQTP